MAQRAGQDLGTLLGLVEQDAVAPGPRRLAVGMVREASIERVDVVVARVEPVGPRLRGHPRLGLAVEVLGARGPEHVAEEPADRRQAQDQQAGLDPPSQVRRRGGRRSRGPDFDFFGDDFGVSSPARVGLDRGALGGPGHLHRLAAVDLLAELAERVRDGRRVPGAVRGGLGHQPDDQVVQLHGDLVRLGAGLGGRLVQVAVHQDDGRRPLERPAGRSASGRAGCRARTGRSCG